MMQAPQNLFRRTGNLQGQGTITRVHLCILALTLTSAFALMLGSLHLVSAREPQNQSSQPKVSGFGDRVSVRAAGCGNPWLNFSDGRDLVTDYVGHARSIEAMGQDQARPLALASADFDEDGVPDLVCSYATGDGGIITLHRGNVDSIYPNAPEAQQRKANGEFTDAPFLSPARVFEIGQSPDFIGAGDYDADGHWDVVAAARGGNHLYLLAGDGKGGFGPARPIGLPGRVTAMASGDLNRRDGLDDLVVGISGEAGAAALVFEGAEGALRAVLESIALRAEASDFALGQLDDEYPIDLAVAASFDLLLVHGRDRKTSLGPEAQATVTPARISRRAFEFPIRSVITGDFSGGHEEELAALTDDGRVHILSRGKAKKGSLARWKSETLTSGQWVAPTRLVRARASSRPVDDLIVIDAASRQVQIITGEARDKQAEKGRIWAALDVDEKPIAVLPMRLNSDALSDLVILREGGVAIAPTAPVAIYVVNSAGDGADCDPNDGICSTGMIVDNQCQLTGQCTLRAAIQQANANAGADAIRFSIGAGPQTISPLSPLPDITDPAVIDGTMQPGFAGTPIIELSGASMGLANGVLRITGGNSTVRGLVINRGNTRGINLVSGGGNIIEGNGFVA